jgi:hypothetical protein
VTRVAENFKDYGMDRHNVLCSESVINKLLVLIGVQKGAGVA